MQIRRRDLCSWPALPLLASASSAMPAEADVFVAGQDGYHTYRIPAVVQTRKGTLLAFCEGRRNSRADWGDIDLLLKRSRDGGKSWSAPICVADLNGDTIGNPAPVVDKQTGIVWLLLTRNPGDVQEKAIAAGLDGATRTVWVTHSRDDGITLAAPLNITSAVKQPSWTWYATGPVNGIQLRTGRLMIPCDHTRGNGAVQYSHVIFSDDSGKSWKLGGSAGPYCNECSVAELADGSLMLNMRNYTGKNRRAVSISRDGGLTWSDPVLDQALIEPVCHGSLIACGKGKRRVLLFSNPASTKRLNMTVRMSRDEAKTWTASKTIHSGPAAYSNLVEMSGNIAGLLYERGEASPYERITFARIPLHAIAASA